MSFSKKKTKNVTNQFDQRQFTQIEQDIEANDNREFEFEDNREFRAEDNSEGKITAGGNVTVESTKASIAASEALTKISDDARKANEEALKAAQAFANGSARLGEKALEESRRIAERVAKTTEELARFSNDTAQEAIKENSSLAKDTSKFVSDIAAKAVEENAKLQDRTLDFLRRDNDEDNKVISDALQDNAELVSKALNSTVGGIAEQQQKTIIAIVLIVGAVLVFNQFSRRS